MSSLNNNFINNTFKSLLKLINNDSFTGNTTQTISDGYGNSLPLSISPTSVDINANLTANKIVIGSGNTSGDNSSVLGGLNNNSSGSFSIIGGGENNTNTREYSSILGGENNRIKDSYSSIGGGENNTISGTLSSIVGGENNYTDKSNSFIIGSNITATTNNTTFVNNLSIDGVLYDITSNSGNTGQILSVGINGVLWTTVDVSALTGDSINKQTFYQYTSDTQTKLNSKLNISDFSSYSANTNTLIGTKLNISDFSSYSANTNTLIGTKLNISDFNSYSSNTLNYINNTLSASTIYNSVLTPSLSMPSSVGGISAGTTVSQLTGLTFSKIFDDLFFPTTYPTYTIPTITIGGVANTTSEVGSTITPSIAVSAVKNDAGVYSLLRILRNGSSIYSSSPTPSWVTAIPNQFGYVNPNNPNSGFTISTYSESYVIPAPSVGGTSSSTIYKSDGDYNIGLAKPTNKNTTDNRSFAVRSTSAPQSASNNFESSPYTYTGIYPYFYGTSATLPTSATIAHAISGGTATKVLSSASGTISIPYNTSGNYIWVAYFNNYTTKTKWYISDLNSGSINNSFITTAASQIIKSPDGYWDGITYKLHWSVNATVVNTLEYRNS